jgi:hypothetical protein
LDVAKTIPSLKGWAGEERNDFVVREADLAEYVEKDLFETDPCERKVDAVENKPIQFEFPV